MDSKLLLFRFLHFIAAIFFLLAAFVQKNDPDPALWIPLYLLPGICSILISVNPDVCRKTAFKRVDFIYVFIATIIISNTLHRNYYPTENNFLWWILNDEAGREFGGLFIVIVWILSMHNVPNVILSALLSLIIIVPCIFWCYIYFNQEIRKLWPQHCQTTLYPG